MIVKIRRRLALTLLAAALLTVTLTVLAALDDGEYVYLRWLAYPLTGIALAFLMLAGAAQLALRRVKLRIGLQVVAGLLAIAALVGQAFTQMLFSTFSPSGESVAAASADFRIVVHEYPGLFGPGVFTLRLQSREGLLSREGKEDLACFIEAGYGSGPEWLLDRARFAGNDEVQVFAKDGTMWRIHFNGRTLLPTNPLDRCTDAPSAD